MKSERKSVARDKLRELSYARLVWRRFKKNRIGYASLFFLAGLYAICLLAEAVAPYEKDREFPGYENCPPVRLGFSLEHGPFYFGMDRAVDPLTRKVSYIVDMEAINPIRLGTCEPSAKGSAAGLFGFKIIDVGGNETPFLLAGSDGFARDLFSRLLYGGRISLLIGLTGVAFSILLGIVIGGASGYFGGKTDIVLQRFIELIDSFPAFPIWLAIAAVLPASWSPIAVYYAITVVLSLLGWTGLARVLRGRFLAVRGEDYVTAAYLAGANPQRIIWRHLLPGTYSHVIVVITLTIPGMILGETALSFLGLGLKPPVVSWGTLLQDAQMLDNISNYPWLLTPALIIIVTVLCFNFLGDALRDGLDPLADVS